MSQKRLCLSFKESKSHALHSKLRKQRNTSGRILRYCYHTHCRGDLPFLPFLANFAFCLNHAYCSFLWFLLLPFVPAKNRTLLAFCVFWGFFFCLSCQQKKSRPFGFLRILQLFRVQQTELVQFHMKACLYNHNMFL